jgi:hypothetical protein
MTAFDYNTAFYTLEDIKEAEVRTRGIIGHSDMQDRLGFMESRNLKEIRWFSLTDCERDLIRDYSGIKPRFKP